MTDLQEVALRCAETALYNDFRQYNTLFFSFSLLSRSLPFRA